VASVPGAGALVVLVVVCFCGVGVAVGVAGLGAGFCPVPVRGLWASTIEAGMLMQRSVAQTRFLYFIKILFLKQGQNRGSRTVRDNMGLERSGQIKEMQN
jgi:hypothetical protein